MSACLPRPSTDCVASQRSLFDQQYVTVVYVSPVVGTLTPVVLDTRQTLSSLAGRTTKVIVLIRATCWSLLRRFPSNQTGTSYHSLSVSPSSTVHILHSVMLCSYDLHFSSYFILRPLLVQLGRA